MSVDPLLGTNDDLRDLFSTAESLGIRVIMDGVFSHTGSDSLYFNRYDRYDSVGAWQEIRDGRLLLIRRGIALTMTRRNS